MRLVPVLVGSLKILLGDRTRSLLAAAGMAMGIGLVLVTSALAEGAKAELLSSTDAMGARLLVVRAASTRSSPARKAIQGLVSSLKREDCADLERFGFVERAAPVLDGQQKVRSNAGFTTAKVVGSTSAILDVRGYSVGQGRFFTDEEEANAARLAVLGPRIAARLFPEEEPLGRSLRVRGVHFEVVGVLQPMGASADGSDHDNQILVPLRTAQRRLSDSRSLTFIYVTLQSADQLDTAEREIARLLRRNHRLTRPGQSDDFAFQSQARAASFKSDLAQSLELLKGGFSFVALLIGGAGILGLMLLSVQERTIEIALRIAVGARQRDVALQFLFESTLLAASGGSVGMVLGICGTMAVERLTQWHALFTFQTVLWPLALAVAIGVVAGVLPAHKAARVPPIQAFAQQ